MDENKDYYSREEFLERINNIVLDLKKERKDNGPYSGSYASVNSFMNVDSNGNRSYESREL